MKLWSKSAKHDNSATSQTCCVLCLVHRLSGYWDVLTWPPPGTVVHLVRGERSDRWTPHMLQQLQEAEESWQEHAAEAPEGVGQLQVRRLDQ